MQEQYSEMAIYLRSAIDASGGSVDELSDLTKVPRSTILALIEEPVAAVLPERVYLRGHLKVLCGALDLDPIAMVDLFDQTYPLAPAASELDVGTLPATRRAAVSAGLYGIALLAVAVAFASAMS